MTRAGIVLIGIALGGFAAAAQTAYPTKFSAALAERTEVRAALAYVDANFERQVAEWIRITEIPAPSGHEAKRAAYVAQQFEKLGLTSSIDGIGNVIVRRPGTGGGPTLVFAAHLDTVFPLDTKLQVERRPDGTLHAPGIFDNAASVANMLQAARALHAAGIRTRGDVIFIGTAQEEVGLKGMYYWLEHNKGVADMLVALDMALGPIHYGALGLYWSRMTFTAPGAHTNNSRGQPSPARAAAQCITDIYTIPLPPADAPVSAVYNVGGLMTGGNVVNAIPAAVTFSVDLRTVDPKLLQSLDAAIVGKCEAAAKAHKVGFVREFIQRSEAGGRPEDLEDRRRHPLVQTAVDTLKYLGVELPAGREALATGSQDSNAGVVQRIPSIAVGRTRGGDGHTLQEWSDIDSARIGTKQIVLLTAALAELADQTPQAAAAPPDHVQTLVDRLDLERYKATIQGLTQFGDRLEGTDRNRAAVDWIEAQLRSYGCVPERHQYIKVPPAPAKPQTASGGGTVNPVIASGEVRRGQGGSRLRGVTQPTTPNNSAAAQPDAALQALNTQPTTPGPREQVYCTKIGADRPDEMYILGAHMDGRGFGEAANDNGSGTALVMELARIFSAPDVRTERSIRFALWNSEEGGLVGAASYVRDRAPLQGKEDPAGSGRYPEPRWLGMIQHDMMLFDHGMPRADGTVGPDQRLEADVNIEFQSNAKRADEAMALAFLLRDANEKYATDYPAAVGHHMTNTDSTPFMDLVPAISLRESERGMHIGAGWDPHWHQPTDRYTTFSDKDFLLGLNAAQTTLGAVARLAGATIK